MSRDFWVELGDVLEEINKNSDIRVVVMSSTGKHFCAGMDLNQMYSMLRKGDHSYIKNKNYKCNKNKVSILVTLVQIIMKKKKMI